MKALNTNGSPISQAFYDAWLSKQGKGGQALVQFKRRFWNESTQQFQYETNWTQFTMRDYVEIGDITFKLDTPLLNEIKTTSVVLKFKNSDYQLLPSNSTSGLFAPDAQTQAVQPANPLRGYEPHQTQFQIIFGYRLASGSFEYVSLFTGLMGEDPNFNVDAGYVEVQVSGFEWLLQHADAQLVSMPLVPAYGIVTTGANDSIDFTVNGGGALHAVVAAGNYTTPASFLAAVVSALNSADSGGAWTAVLNSSGIYQGLVTLSRGSGVMVLKFGSGSHASTSCAGLLGFLSADTSSAISATGLGQPTTGSGFAWSTSVTSPAPVIALPSPYDSTKITGTGAGVMAPNLVVYDSGRTIGGGYSNGPLLQQGTDYSISQESTAGSPLKITLNQSAVGTISYNGRQWLALPDFQILVTLLAIQAGMPAYNIQPVVFGSGTVVTNIGLFTGTNYTAAWTAVVTNGSISGSGGILSILGSGHTSGTTTATTPSTPAYGVWTFSMLSNVQFGFGLPRQPLAVYFILSQANPLSGSPSGYAMQINGNPSTGVITCSLLKVVSGSASTLASATAPAGMGGTFLATAGGGPQQWTITRGSNGLFQVFCAGFLVLSATDNTVTTSTNFTVTCTGDDANPIFYDTTISIGSIVNTFSAITTLADFTGLTCYDAIQNLAKLANYVWGCDYLGVLQFGPRNLSTIPIVQPNGSPIPFSQSDGISRVLEFRPGFNEVINDAQVTTPGFYREYRSSTSQLPSGLNTPTAAAGAGATAPETAPTSQQKHGTTIQSEDYSEFQLAYDPIIAGTRAQQLHDVNYRARRLARIRTKILPFLELSDVLSFTYVNDLKQINPIFGDPMQKWGVPAFGLPTNVLARNMPGNTISLLLNPNSCDGEVMLQEVLS